MKHSQYPETGPKLFNKNQKKSNPFSKEKNLYPNSKMAEMLELAPKDFDAAIIIILKEIRDNVLTMNEKKKKTGNFS